MYHELLDVVRNPEALTDDDASTDATKSEISAAHYKANMPAILEESEPEFPSFSQKKKGFQRGDSEFDEVVE